MATKYRKVRAVNPAKKLAWNWRRTNVMQAFADAHAQGIGPAYNWKYAKEIGWLEREGLVQGSETTGYVLTPAGMAEARRRDMLPSSHLHNPSHGGITIEEQSVLEQLARDAEDSGDDWGISQGVADYLAQAYHNRATDPPDTFLQDLQGDVWWHYRHSGEGKESEGADPMYSEESAKRAEKLIGVARRKLPSYRDPLEPLRRAARAPNPRFRYAAVPVEHNGHETAHVVRGKRRTDMVRSVARSVPGDAVVDLGRTRTFATKHEATAYAKRTSPAVRNGSRR